jgi:translation initiation factor 5B
MIRAPICAVVGHVDHGKTTLLDTVRGTATAGGEAGAITQAIGASIVPIKTIMSRAAGFVKETKIPGLLFIDTPGHAAFTGMRERGGSLADIAVLIVDMNEGFKPQTVEALKILRNHKTPFIVAANKVDLAPGYRKQEEDIIKDINAQQANVNQYLETKLYELVGTLSEHGMNSERFDRVNDFKNTVAICPISALTGHGVDTLLALLVGLAQRFLEGSLAANTNGPAKGTVLEVAEEQGMGLTLNAIIYDGTLRVGDEIIIGTLHGKPIETKVRALLQPDDVGDIRDKKTLFKQVKEAVSATGVKISAPDLDGVAAGMPFGSGDREQLIQDFEESMSHVSIDTDAEGVILKADNVGSLEALVQLLREKNIPIGVADVGPVSKKDLVRAASNPAEVAVVLAFNLPQNKEKAPEGVKVYQENIIYALVDRYEEHLSYVEEQEKSEQLQHIPLPAQLKVLPNCMFRASNPLVCGVEVLQGVLKRDAKLVQQNDPINTIGYVKDIQEKKDSVKEAQPGVQVAISVPGATAGRQINEEDIVWAGISEKDYLTWKENAKHLEPQQKAVLKAYAEIMRESNPLWGV